MLSNRRAAFLLAAVLALPLLAPVAATAQEGPISVKANMARILRISAPAATVIIGNPGVADVTIQDPQTLVLTGKSYGTTNLIVLDSDGNPIADTMIEVVQSQADTDDGLLWPGADLARLRAGLPANAHAGRRRELLLEHPRLVEHHRGRRQLAAR